MMALPSLATRPPPARREPAALVDSENVAPAPPPAAAGLIARIKAILAERSDNRLAQLIAGEGFLVRGGIEGAGVATSSALVAESIMLYLVAKRRLGFHVFIMGGASRA
jgi:hypothetical protein